MHPYLSQGAVGVVARVHLLSSVIALSSGMLDVLTRVMRYAAARSPVVFVGEPGTGKSLFAAVLHEASERPGPFVEVSAQELAPELTRSALFGHVRGAFTGAERAHVGYLAQAERGTLLLDDFHLMRRSVQAMLLRAIERNAYRPVGAERDVPMTCRLVFGLGRDPGRLVAQRRMLPDLRSRLGFMVVKLPPLAERREEIPPLAAHFLSRAPEDLGVAGGPTEFSPTAIAALTVHPYPANVRDLRELVREGYLHARQIGSAVLGVEHLDGSIWAVQRGRNREENRRLITWALEAERGNVLRAARRVGVSKNTVKAVRAKPEAV